MDAVGVAAALNHSITQRFINSVVFLDAKRPITKALLSRINLITLIEHLPTDELISAMRQTCQKYFPSVDTGEALGEDATLVAFAEKFETHFSRGPDVLINDQTKQLTLPL